MVYGHAANEVVAEAVVVVVVTVLADVLVRVKTFLRSKKRQSHTSDIY